MAKVFKNLDEAIQAQEAQAKKIKLAKKELTSYYSKHKLDRLDNYADNAKHGPKIRKFQQQIDNEGELLTQINSQMAKLDKGGKKTAEKKAEKAEKGPAKGVTKYEYPPEVDTPDKRKKYRIAQRKLAEGGEPKAKKEKAGKEEAKSKDKASTKTTKDTAKVEETKTSKKVKSKSKEEPAKEEKSSKSSKKKIGSKKTKKADD